MGKQKIIKNNIIRHLKYALIPRGSILDIGSGNNPFWRANVLMERYLADDTQREGQMIIDRPIVCGDVQELPFVDKAFTFINCSHVLEHTQYPEKAISEMLRVGKSGYLETPSEIHETVDLNKSYHRWIISEEDGILVFREKSQCATDHPLIQIIKNPKNRSSMIIRKLHDDINFIKIFWRKDINIRVERSSTLIEEFPMNNDLSRFKVEKESAKSNSKMRIKNILNKLYFYRVRLDRLIACPICKIKVMWQHNKVVCNSCGVYYPIINKVPIMLRDVAKVYKDTMPDSW